MREPRYPLPRVVCVFTTKWARLRRTRTANGGATTDGHLFIPIPWRNSRRGLFVLPRGHGFPCHRDREGMGRNEATTPLPLMFDNTFTGRSARQVSTMILPQVHLRKPCYDFSFL
ncbi:hypothetical protein V6N13_116785 [Hibiscus sabdariffa]